MTTPEETFSLDRLERWTYTGEYEDAARMILSLFRSFDSTYGHLGEIGSSPSDDFSAEQRDVHFATRIASAMTALFSNPGFQLSPGGFRELIKFQRWLATVFGASPFSNADHVIRVLNLSAETTPGELKVAEKDLLKFCLLYSLDSRMPLRPAALWEKDKRLGASLCLALLSSRIAITEEAHAKREILLEWFPPRIADLSLDEIPAEILHDVWMHCSYAARPDKHEIKGKINELIRKQMLSVGFSDMPIDELPDRDKPVLMCIVEWFTSNHAMYRCYAEVIQALQSSYHVIGVSLGEMTDDISREVFNETQMIPRAATIVEKLKKVTELAATIRPDVVYYPSVGMFLETIFLINLRLAPVQVVTLGHPATTHSPCADYVLLEEDTLGDPECFTEQLVVLPVKSLPFRKPANCPQVEPILRRDPDVVRIAVTAAVMKLNPVFLSALRQIEERCQTGIEFRFFTGHAIGLGKVYVQNLIQRFLSNSALVYPHLNYAAYIEQINECDMFLNPFPFGNTNGIVDTVRQRLPGVCMTGREVHSCIDGALFRRLGLPDWLVAKDTQEYIDIAVRLAEDHKLREKLSKDLQKLDPDTVLFHGNTDYFVEAMDWIRKTHGKRSPTDPKDPIRPVWNRKEQNTSTNQAGKARPKTKVVRRSRAQRQDSQ